MLAFLPPVVRGVIAMVLLGLNTLFWCALLFAFSLVKLLLPHLKRSIRLHAKLDYLECDRRLFAGAVNRMLVGMVTFAQDGSILFPAGDVPDYATIEEKSTVFVKGVIGEIPKS